MVAKKKKKRIWAGSVVMACHCSIVSSGVLNGMEPQLEWLNQLAVGWDGWASVFSWCWLGPSNISLLINRLDLFTRGWVPLSRVEAIRPELQSPRPSFLFHSSDHSANPDSVLEKKPQVQVMGGWHVHTGLGEMVGSHHRNLLQMVTPTLGWYNCESIMVKVLPLH